jgi:hypothetical protein
LDVALFSFGVAVEANYINMRSEKPLGTVITYLTHQPRSGRKHKAWGVSPRIEIAKCVQPAERATAVDGTAGVFNFFILKMYCDKKTVTFMRSVAHSRGLG